MNGHLAGQKSRLVLRLTGADHTRLVDESVRVSADAATQPVQSSWDVTEVQPATAGVFTIAADLANGTHRSWSIAVVDRLDDVTVAAGSTQAIDAPITMHGGATFCFDGKSGSLSVRGLLSTLVVAGNATMWNDPFLNCVAIKPITPGPATLTVTIAGLKRTFPLTIVE